MFLNGNNLLETGCAMKFVGDETKGGESGTDTILR